jgi:hypothetical protein
MKIHIAALPLSCLLVTSAAWAALAPADTGAVAQTAAPERGGGVAERPLARDPRSARQLTVQVGFGHWFGKNFGAPIGATTPALTVGWRPGLRWLELRAYYSVTTDPLVLPTTGERSVVGFAQFDVTLSHELRVGRQRMVMGCGPSGGFVHTKEGFGISLGSDIFARYLIDVSGLLAVGPFVDVRAMYYHLPGSDVPLIDVVDGDLKMGHNDTHIQIGVAGSLW